MYFRLNYPSCKINFNYFKAVPTKCSPTKRYDSLSSLLSQLPNTEKASFLVCTVLCYITQPVWLGHMFCNYLINGMLVGKKVFDMNRVFHLCTIFI